jgi:hypothetical protein
MALTESISSTLEVAADGTVFVNTEISIFRDNTKIASEVNRTGYHPGADVSSLPDSIQAVCAAVWMPEVLEAWQKRIDQPNVVN